MWNPYDPKANLEFDAYDDNAALNHLRYLNEQRKAESGDGQTFRMGRINWAPGEFEEWKQGHITGLGTEYGRNMQRLYKQRKTPGVAALQEQGAANARRVMSGQVGPAFLYLLGQNYGR